MTETSMKDHNRPIVIPERARPHVLWRIGIVFVAVTLIWLFIGELAEARYGQDYDRTAHVMRAVLASLLVIPLIVFARHFLDRRPWRGLRLDSLRIGWRPLLVGMVCWLIPAAVGMMVALALGWTEIRLDESIGETLLLAGALVMLVFIYEALPEELIFRGYFYRNLAAEMPLWMAVVAQAVLFMLWGILNGGENSMERNVLFFSFALLMGVFRAVTGSVWASIGFHLAFQTVAQLFGTVGSQFTVSEPNALMVFAFVVVPFTLGFTILNRFYTNQPDWRERVPDPAE